MYQTIGILTYWDKIKHQYWDIHMLSYMQFSKHCGSNSYKTRLMFYQNNTNIMVFNVFFSSQYQWFNYLIKESKQFLELNNATSEVNFRVFKDGSSDLEITTVHTLWPHTHTNMGMRLQHFCSFIRNGGIHIHRIGK